MKRKLSYLTSLLLIATFLTTGCFSDKSNENAKSTTTVSTFFTTDECFSIGKAFLEDYFLSIDKKESMSDSSIQLLSSDISNSVLENHSAEVNLLKSENVSFESSVFDVELHNQTEKNGVISIDFNISISHRLAGNDEDSGYKKLIRLSFKTIDNNIIITEFYDYPEMP